MKLYRYLLAIISLFLIIVILVSYETKTLEVDIEKDLRVVATNSYLENKVLQSLSNEKYDEVEIYLGIADFLNIKLNENILKEIEKNNTFWSKSWKNTKEFSKGFVSGESDNSMGFAGSVTSDFTVVGDIRDISKEGTKLVKGETYDEIVLGIAVIGVGITASQIVSVGSTTPLKVGASIIKFAKKTGKLSNSFISLVSSKITRTIDFKSLSKIDFKNMTKLKKSIQVFTKNIDISHSQKLFDKITDIKKNTSALDTVFLIKYIDNQNDLNKMLKLSEKFGKNTKGVFKILGKGALKTGKSVVKYTTLFVAELVSLAISILLFIFSFFSKVSFFRRFFNKKV